jgi:hypothetical protein
MRVWRFRVVLLVVVVAASGCARAGEAPAVLPTDTVLVAQWHRAGGFVPATVYYIDAPDLAVYSDGRAVAGADRELTLPADEVRALLTDLRTDLRGLNGTVTREGDLRVADAPTTEITVLTSTGERQIVAAEALGIGQGYPDRLVAAEKRLSTLAARVTDGGAPFTSDRIRLVAEVSAGEASPRPWPAGVPVPPTSSGVGRTADLGGDEAAAVVRELPTAHWPGAGPGVALVTPDGTAVRVTWRYLLPSE